MDALCQSLIITTIFRFRQPIDAEGDLIVRFGHERSDILECRSHQGDDQSADHFE